MLQQAEDPVTLNQAQIVRHQTSPENTLRLFSLRLIALICNVFSLNYLQLNYLKIFCQQNN